MPILYILAEKEFMGGLFAIANVHGFAMVGNYNSVRPQLKPNDCSIADVLFTSQIYNVRPTCTKPNVSGRRF
jgi:hypothetical protein